MEALLVVQPSNPAMFEPRSDRAIALAVPANEISAFHLRRWRPEGDGTHGEGYLSPQ